MFGHLCNACVCDVLVFGYVQETHNVLEGYILRLHIALGQANKGSKIRSWVDWKKETTAWTFLGKACCNRDPAGAQTAGVSNVFAAPKQDLLAWLGFQEMENWAV